MKKLILIIVYLLYLSVECHAATHYFAQGSPDNTLPCTLLDPCDHFAGTTLDNSGAIAAGDSVLFKRGDVWEGSEALVISNSPGTADNFITFGAYGTGALPKFAGGAVTGASWSNSSGSIYLATSQSNSTVRAVSTADDDKGLIHWDGTNTNLAAGSYCWTTSQVAGTSCANTNTSATNLYIRTYDSGTPASHGGIRLSTVSLSIFTPLVGGVNNSNNGKYNRFRDLVITNSPARGFTVYYAGNEVNNVHAYGSTQDGLDLDDNCNNCWIYYPYTAYNDTRTSSAGQGITVQSLGTGVTGTGGARSEAEYNGQAGFDALDYGANNATQITLLRTTMHENGIGPSSSADPNIYFDGSSEWFAYGNRVYDAGKGLAAVNGTARYGVQFGSEHASTDPNENGYWINNLVFENHSRGYYAICSSGINCVKNLTQVYNTYVGNDDTSGDSIQFIIDPDTTANNWVQRNNIMMGNSGDYVNHIVTAMGSLNYLDSDFNLYYMRGEAAATTDIMSTNGAGGTKYDLSEWRTLSGEDASAVYGDPLFVSEATLDFHLSVGSAAFDIGTTAPYSYPAWLYQEIKDDIGVYGIKGSTIAAGTEDNYATAPDAGFHYDYATPTSIDVEPASLIQNSIGNLTITFTIPKYLGGILYDGRVIVTLPSGFTWSDGAATTVTSSTISGTWTFGSSGQVGTFTRVGDGDSEFYGSYNIVATNVGVPAATGAAGAYTVQLGDSASYVIMQGVAASDTILLQPNATHFSCSAITNRSGITIS